MLRREVITLIGGAVVVVLPLVTRAQQSMPVIGYLSVRSPATDDYRLAAFGQGLSETGYDEGRNVAIEYHYAQGHQKRLAGLGGRSGSSSGQRDCRGRRYPCGISRQSGEPDNPDRV